MNEFWNKRYSTENYVYGINPNLFFKECIDKLNPGRILLPGEGEGRNAVYAAGLGWKTNAFDFSEEGRRKALNLAEKQGVVINYSTLDIADFIPETESYDAAALVFLHLEEELREKLHSKVIASLKPGGALILEAFEKSQLGNNSGGPKEEEKLYSLEDIFSDFQDMDFTRFEHKRIKLEEGEHHNGEAEVIRLLAFKEK